ncbi:MAG TPA: signal recognition particle-docking protein FtsY [Gammaproteobacteria bacterium]|nr:signal recognition particle-docking protein FtsY [Gammaproteobacteria bacterium]HIK70807.1 signal recognition particle-docking protein FtsY [Pseudomonadales bacterium]
MVMSNVADTVDEGKQGLLARFKQGLSKTRSGLTKNLGRLFLGAKTIDADLLEEIETLLITGDFGVEVTQEIIQDLTDRVSRKTLADSLALRAVLRDLLIAILEPVAQPLVLPADAEPAVVLMVGVNGSGKTTTAGKLAHYFKAAGRKVLLAAGDTFRAAAVEQLQVWGDRNQVDVIAQHTGADSASVIFDSMTAAKSRGTDVLIADTAGRLQNKKNLMDELAKIERVLKRQDPQAPQAVLLVIDAGTGQNAISQAREFLKAVAVTGIVLTKLDGTARGGILFALARQLALPIHFVGIGEQVDDLRPFSAEIFVDAILDND